MDMDIYRRIGLACSRIPRGRVATYGQIALLCGKPGNSRQVGYALKKGLAGENVPAHRVVNAAGILSGAAHFASMDLQCLLLREEGVEVLWTPKGWKTDLKRYGWKNTMEEALELHPAFQSLGFYAIMTPYIRGRCVLFRPQAGSCCAADAPLLQNGL